MRSGHALPTESSCFRMATAYLARRAASKLQLRRYLLRKLARTEPAEGDPACIEDIVDAVLARLERLQLIDEAGLAQSRARTLTAKGYPQARLRAHLAGQGFNLSDPLVAPSLELEDDAQALRYAQRKRLGPYAVDPRRSSFERDVRALIRAGFAADVVLRVVRRFRASMPDEGEAPDLNGS